MRVRPFTTVAAGLASVIFLAVPTPSPAGASDEVQGAKEIRAYCKAHPTADFPGKTKAGDLEDNTYAHILERAGADNWRCMGGRVLVCSGGASGSACYKLNPSLKPNKDIIETCRDRPNLDFVAMATTVYSSSTWRCKGRTPVIIHTYPLDKRGFLAGAWRPLFDAHGRPKAEMDLPADPR